MLVEPKWARAFVAAARRGGNTDLLDAFKAGGELSDLLFATAIAEASSGATTTSSAIASPAPSLDEPAALLTPSLARIVETYVAASFLRILADADTELRVVLTACTMNAPARVNPELCAQWNAMRDAVAVVADSSEQSMSLELGEPLDPTDPPTALWFFSEPQGSGSPLRYSASSHVCARTQTSPSFCHPLISSSPSSVPSQRFALRGKKFRWCCR
jgi:hypothetical protein